MRAAEQKQKPSNERIRGYQDSALPTLEQKLFSTAPVYKGLEKVLLAESLTEMQDVLGANDETVKTGAGRQDRRRSAPRKSSTAPSWTMSRFASSFTKAERRRSKPAPIR